MNNLSFLVDNGNDFSESDIKKASDSFLRIFYIEKDEIPTVRKEEEKSKIQEKNELLQLYLEFLNKTLYSNLLKEKEEKISIIKIIDKLKIQNELMELLATGDSDNKVMELLATSDRFGKKAQSSVEE